MSEPLTKDKIRCVPPEYIEEHGCECCCKNTKVMLKDDVLSAVMLLREKIDNLYRKLGKPNVWRWSNDEVVDNCEEYFKKAIDEVFGGVEK